MIQKILKLGIPLVWVPLSIWVLVLGGGCLPLEGKWVSLERFCLMSRQGLQIGIQIIACLIHDLQIGIQIIAWVSKGYHQFYSNTT